MKQDKSAASVATFADHEVIRPRNTLTKALKRDAGEALSEESLVAQAEAALAQLAGEFPVWMKAECDRLDVARRRVREIGLERATPDQLFRAAHDIRGQAATYGYPAAAKTAESLCRLIEHSPDLGKIPLDLIDQHVDGVRAIIREDLRKAGSTVATDLAMSLSKATDDFLLRENRHRPDYVRSIIAPPLAPKR
jgi:HPt (histidine-containing phosphotransfer) domain-containing protein